MSQDENPRANRTLLSKSMIRHTQNNSFVVKCISAVDIFSFIPVPKSKPVSTRCSLIGTALFFAIFFAYIIYDLVTFIKDNPPMPNSYYEKLGSDNYTSPKFSMVFMKGEQLNEHFDPQGTFNYTVQENIKTQLKEDKNYSNFVPCDESSTKKWLSDKTFNNYGQFMVCPNQSVPLYMGGLLYVYQYAYNPSIKLMQCYNGANFCKDREQIQSLQSQGRVFFFIEKEQGSQYDQKSTQSGSYYLYNFFMVQQQYKRINIQFQVNKEIILPDYLTRWTQTQKTWIQILSVSEMTSDVAPLYNKSDPAKTTRNLALLLSIQFTLNPSIKITKVAYLTLVDHIAQWGALWGVQFAFFAIFFLSYNSRKYYKKNPKWEKFDESEHDNSIVST